MEKRRLSESHLQTQLSSFYSLVSGFRHLYDDLREMVEFGQYIPKEEENNVQEIEENLMDFFGALRDLCDEDEDIGQEFKGKYPLMQPESLIAVVRKKYPAR